MDRHARIVKGGDKMKIKQYVLAVAIAVFVTGWITGLWTELLSN